MKDALEEGIPEGWGKLLNIIKKKRPFWSRVSTIDKGSAEGQSRANPHLSRDIS
jgi:hypothetical protein